MGGRKTYILMPDHPMFLVSKTRFENTASDPNVWAQKFVLFLSVLQANVDARCMVLSDYKTSRPVLRKGQNRSDLPVGQFLMF
jgi:hypothetical protein